MTAKELAAQVAAVVVAAGAAGLLDDSCLPASQRPRHRPGLAGLRGLAGEPADVVGP